MKRSKTIHLEEPNTLYKFLSREEQQSVVSLKITGVLGLKDFEVMDEMCSSWGEYDDDENFLPDYEESPALRILDMGEASFGEGDYLPEFGFHSLLEVLILPNNLQSAGEGFDSGLSEAKHLHTLILPQTLKFIGGFNSCPRLKNLILPDGLEEILPHAFCGCDDITSIRIPASVCRMDGSSFAGCQIKAYEVDENNPYLTAVDGVVYNKNLNVLIAFPSAYPHKHYKLLDSVRRIGYNAFMYALVESVEMPEGIATIDKWAFQSSRVKRIDMPDRVTEIGQGVFRFCSQLEQIHLSNQLTEIPRLSFSSCPKLTVLDVPSSVRKLYYSAVAWSHGLEHLILHDGLEEIVDEGPLGGCEGDLREIKFPKTLKKVQGGLFNYSPHIKSYQIDPDNPYFCVIDGALYSKDGKILYAVPDPERTHFTVAEGTEEIAEKAFFYLSALRDVELPNSLLTIGDRAFQGCGALKTIRLPKHVMSVGAYFLLSCDKVEKVVIDSTVPPKMTGHVKDDMWEFKKVKLIVPQGTAKQYQNALGWKCFIVKDNK